jgi:DNA-binding NarL/FixJ family response regulator
LAISERSRNPTSVDAVSKRQQQIIELVAAGKTNKQIGAILNLSPATVKRHVGKMLRARHLQRRLQLASLSRLNSPSAATMGRSPIDH